MADFNTPLLQDIAVRCTERFLNDKIPLSQALAKEACDHGLNSDQVQRCVEATNTVAFLKIKSMSPDKTVEFPLAKYAEVIKEVSVPETLGEVKQASQAVLGATAEIKEEVSLEKFASTLVVAEQEVYFTKMAAENNSRIADLDVAGRVLANEMIKVASQIKADDKGLWKIAQVLDGRDFAAVTAMVYGEVKAHPGVFGAAMFKPYETAPVENLASMYKQACAMEEELASRKETALKAETFRREQELTKIAGLFDGVFGKPPTGGQKGVAQSAAQKFSSAKAAVGARAAKIGAPRNAIDKAVSGTTRVLASPIGAAANIAVKKPIGAMAQTAKYLGQSAMSSARNSSVVQKFAGPGKAAPVANKTVGRVLAGAGIASSIAFNAPMYTPGVDKDTGVSKDVWDSLG